MAGYLFHFNPLFIKFTGNIFSRTIGTVGKIRLANKQIKAIGGRKQFFVKPGTLIHCQKEIILCPGLNVGVNRLGFLYAKLPGRVRLTLEKTNFDSSHGIVKWNFPENLPKVKKYVNVIPKPQSKAFKLVEKF